MDSYGKVAFFYGNIKLAPNRGKRRVWAKGRGQGALDIYLTFVATEF